MLDPSRFHKYSLEGRRSGLSDPGPAFQPRRRQANPSGDYAAVFDTQLFFLVLGLLVFAGLNVGRSTDMFQVTDDLPVDDRQAG